MEENKEEVVNKETKIEDASNPKAKKIFIFCIILLIIIILLTVIILSVWGNNSSNKGNSSCDDSDTCHIHFIKLLLDLL